MREAKRLSGEAYLLKPVKKSQLVSTILHKTKHGEVHSQEASEKPDAREDQRQNKNIRILLAEDNPVNRKLAIAVLTKAGYTVDAVVNGLESLRSLEEQTYNVVLMDVQMPEMDGFEATAAIRKSDKPWRDIPVLAMTAHAMQGDREKCLQAGMNDYLTKPIQPKSLVEAVIKWTQVKQNHIKEVNAMTEENVKSETKTIPINFEEALERCGGDKEFLNEMLNEFLNLSKSQLVHMAEAIGQGNAQELNREAHSLKGASATLGAEAVAKVALELELCGKQEQLENASPILERLVAQVNELRDYVARTAPVVDKKSE
jgi:CheY-like chemotaxis protein